MSEVKSEINDLRKGSEDRKETEGERSGNARESKRT